MSFESQTKTVIELVREGALWIEDGNHGENRPLAHEFSAQGTPFVRPDDLVSGVVVFNGCDRINDVALKRIRKGKGRAGDIVFTHRATVGRIARVGSDAPDFVANPGVTVYRATCPELLDANYLYYFMQAPFFMRQVWAEAGNTDTFPYVSLTQQRKLKVSFPEIKVQRAIGEILGAIDDRIRLLRETNATLEAIAQALFKSWFVDFDPVRAKVEGRQPEGMDAVTAALFPDSFEKSESAVVPKGWRVLPFTETITVIGGGTPKTSVSEYWNGEIPWFSVVDAPNTADVFVLDTEKHISIEGLKNSSAKLLPIGTTIISARGTVGRLALVGSQMAMNQSCYGLCGKPGDAYFTYFSTCRLVEALKQRAHGSVFDTITRDTLAGVDVTYPTVAVINAFESFLSPLLGRVKSNIKQAKSLTQLRDTLLPRLISGQLRLPEADALVADGARACADA